MKSAAANPDIKLDVCYDGGPTSKEVPCDGTGGPGPLGGTTIMEEGFENVSPGGVKPGWAVYDNDSDGYSWEGYQGYPYEGDFHLRVRYNSSGNDDWLVTPMVHVPAGGDSFEFYARAYSSYYPESWEVWISNTGNTVNDFIVSGTPLGSNSTSSTTYALYSYPILPGYNDTDAWIAIRYNAVDMYYLFVDAVSMPNLGFFEGFNSEWLPAGWTTINSNTVRPWTYVDAVTYPQFVHSGNYAAWINYDSVNPSDNWLITDDIDLSGYGAVYLSFWAESDTLWPGATMELHVMGATFDDVVWDMILDESWSTFEYREVSLNLSAYIGEIVQIAWRYVGFDGESFGLDDILLFEPPAHDVGVSAINYSTGTVTDPVMPVNVTVTNYGQNPETNVPVNVTIERCVPTVFFDEDFESGLPGDWTVIDGGTTTDTWTDTNPGGRTPQGGCAGTFMIADSDWAGSGGIVLDEQLISPVIDCSTYSNVWLNFDHYFNNLTSDTAAVYVKNATSGWVLVVLYTLDNLGHQSFDISTVAAGESAVQVMWDYKDNAVWAWYWMVDNVELVTKTCTVDYDETVYTDVGFGASVPVDLPDWVPGGPQGVEIEYQITACTQMIGDEDPLNDCTTGTAAYQYFDFDDLLLLFCGYWNYSTYGKAYDDTLHWRGPGTGVHKVAWIVNTVIPPSDYNVFTYKWSHLFSHLMATNARYKVVHAAGVSPWILVDLSTPGTEWLFLGQFPFDDAYTQAVMVTDQANGFVIVDAIKLINIGL